MDIDLISPQSSVPENQNLETEDSIKTDENEDTAPSKELISVKIIRCFQNQKRNSKNTTNVHLSSTLLPLFQEYFKDWNVLDHPNFGYELLNKWKTFSQTKNQSVKDAFELFLWKHWVPIVQNAITHWNPQYPNDMIDFISHWGPLLPSWMINNLLNHHILMRLETELDNVQPSSVSPPIHTWIHPWFPIFKNNLKELHYSILQAIKRSLKDWQPCSETAKQMLTPWGEVVSKKTLEKFVAKNICPKLSLYVHNTKLDRTFQQADVIDYIFTWEHFISPQRIFNIFKENFFLKWLKVLSVWLAEGGNFEEVVTWFQFWRQLFRLRFGKNVVVDEYLIRALDYISQATFLLQPGLYMNERSSMPDISKIVEERVKPKPSIASSSTLTFKELIEQRALEENIAIIPLKCYFNESRQLYQFGKCTIYLEKGVIYVKNKKSWWPISLNELLNCSV